MAFQGSLAELHLPDIIQLISVSGKSGVFHLVDGPHQGQIYLHDGKIVHAQLDDTAGEEAVYALAIWSQGDFKFEHGVATEHRTISKSNTNLLMEAARRLDEWRVLSKKIPSTDHDPRVRRAGAPRGADQPEHQRVADPVEDRRPAQHQADGRGQRAVRLRRGQDPLRPGRHRAHPPARSGARRRPGGRRRAPAARRRLGGPGRGPGFRPAAPPPAAFRREQGAAGQARAHARRSATTRSGRSARPS